MQAGPKKLKKAWQRVQPWIDAMEFFTPFFITLYYTIMQLLLCAYNMRYEMIRGDRKRGNDPLHVIHKAVYYCIAIVLLWLFCLVCNEGIKSQLLGC